MIVVDTSVLVPAVVEHEDTGVARQVASRDGIWIVPPLWQYEFTNVMATFVRNSAMTPEAGRDALLQARLLVSNRVVAVDQDDALQLAVSLGISGYDAQYIALASDYGVYCVTRDRRLADRAGKLAMRLDPGK